MRFFISAMDSATSESVRFLNTKVSATAPAASNALAVSYSQFVPGKTGIKTLGLAYLFGDTATFLFSKLGQRISPLFPGSDRVGNIPSNGAFHAFERTSSGIEELPTLISGLSMVVPIGAALSSSE